MRVKFPVFLPAVQLEYIVEQQVTLLSSEIKQSSAPFPADRSVSREEDWY
jgi:hypothetical protein